MRSVTIRRASEFWALRAGRTHTRSLRPPRILLKNGGGWIENGSSRSRRRVHFRRGDLSVVHLVGDHQPRGAGLLIRKHRSRNDGGGPRCAARTSDYKLARGVRIFPPSDAKSKGNMDAYTQGGARHVGRAAEGVEGAER